MRLVSSEMSSVKAEDPRANQKARTRAAIIAAAQELQRQGTAPTVEQAAEQARVSRATAYRYFPTKEALLIEVLRRGPGPVAPVEALLADFATNDVGQRLLLLLDTFDRIVLAEEEHVRTATRVYMDTWLRSRRNGDDAPVVREGRRMRWLEAVLAPLDDLLRAQTPAPGGLGAHTGSGGDLHHEGRLPPGQRGDRRRPALGGHGPAARRAQGSSRFGHDEPRTASSERPIDGRPGPGGGP